MTRKRPDRKIYRWRNVWFPSRVASWEFTHRVYGQFRFQDYSFPGMNSLSGLFILWSIRSVEVSLFNHCLFNFQNVSLAFTDGARVCKSRQEAHQLVGRQNAAPQKFDPKPSEVSFSALFRTSITCGRKYIVTSYPVWLQARRV